MTSPNPAVPSPLLLRLIDVVAVTLRYVFPWLALCAALYLVLEIIRAAAGPGSEAWIVLTSNVTRTRTLAFIFGVLGALYGIQQRNLRRFAVLRLKARIEALERELAAGRSTSDPS